MSLLEDQLVVTPNSKKKKKKRLSSWSNLLLKNSNPLKHVVFSMHLQPFSASPVVSPSPPKTIPSELFDRASSLSKKCEKFKEVVLSNLPRVDRTVMLSDDIMLNILSKLSVSQRNNNCLVCKRWLNLQGRLVRSVRVLEWDFLESGRLNFRFPNLTKVDMVSGCFSSVEALSVWVSNRHVTMGTDSIIYGFCPVWRVSEERLLPSETIDRGLGILAASCPNLRRLAVVGASQLGLLSVAEECSTLQELELHKCNDDVLRGIAACGNLQVLRLIGKVDDFYTSSVTDTGLTILAQGCNRLVKLELTGCEGGFDGIKALGQCCPMLEELTISDHRMEGNWLAGLPFCENLRSLRILSCKSFDSCAGVGDDYGSCPALERLFLHNCLLKDRRSIKALFKVCEAVQEIDIEDCWGFGDDALILANSCRHVHSLSLVGCSLLTAGGLETLLLSWTELKQLRIESCKNIKNCDVSAALSAKISDLKELRWRPDSKQLLASGLRGAGIAKRGSKFFRKL